MRPFVSERNCFFSSRRFSKNIFTYSNATKFLYLSPKTIYFRKCLPTFFPRDSILCIISGKVIRNHNINDGYGRNVHLQIFCLLLPVVPWFLLLSQRIWYKPWEGIDLHVHGKKVFHRFYTFELIIHFLAEEYFFNMHLDNLLNTTSEVWIV